MPGAYETDLAYIHDAGFTGYLRQSAPGLMAILRRAGVHGGSVNDLGCASGRWAAILNRAGYPVTGIDHSAAMLRLARANAPESRFVQDSLCTAEIPPCDAITSISECISYAFDVPTRRAGLPRLFRRAYEALRPGGLFIFDFATPNIIPNPQPRKAWWQGEDWSVLVETTGDWRRKTLTRQITSFRRGRGAVYRRHAETHILSLFDPQQTGEQLRAAGFRVSMLERYGSFPLPSGITALVGYKRHARVRHAKV